MKNSNLFSLIKTSLLAITIISTYSLKFESNSELLGLKCTSNLKESDSSHFWMENIVHEGKAPFNKDPENYKVFRNVKEFGAKGDGITDDTDAINNAISYGNRCGRGCDSSTVDPALVYFPSGTYLISRPIIQYYYTQLVGDAVNLPILKASQNFGGIAIIDSNPYIEGGANWYTNQNNFYRQIRNFIIDMTSVLGNATGIHWQVAQATSLFNLNFKMATDGRNHQGIFMENGSGGFMSDLEFEGGKLGMFLGNQQFTYRNITIKNAATAIQIIWNWGFTLKGLNISNCNLGVDISSLDQGKQLVGSVIIVDSNISHTKTFLKTSTHKDSQPHTSGSLILDNIKLDSVEIAIQGPWNVLLGNTEYIKTWGQGQFYNDNSGKGIFLQGELSLSDKPSALIDVKTKAFFERQKPQYEKYLSSDFISVKTLGAKGDGKTDDTDAIKKTIEEYHGCKIIYFPAGIYLISSTITIPSNTALVGEVWSTLSATGKEFSDMNKPIPMLKIGNKGDKGLVEISDLLFSSSGQTPGAILVEWNIRDPDGRPGSSGMWDSHFRIGGALGTNLDSNNCTKFVAKTEDCQGVHTLLYLTETSSAYLENVWAWTADHDLDNNHNQISIFNGRGILIESKEGPIWMYGTASEHNVLYQYNISNSKNVLLAMIQTETPYYQSQPAAPYPFTNNFSNDPDFSYCQSFKCKMAWGLMIQNSDNILLYGAGLYNFFQNYDQNCLNTEDCQESMVKINDYNKGLILLNTSTKASTNMIYMNDKGFALQSENRNTFCSTISVFLPKKEVNTEFSPLFLE